MGDREQLLPVAEDENLRCSRDFIVDSDEKAAVASSFNRMKTREAAIEVLLTEGRPTGTSELAQEIKKRGLHPLPTTPPGSVVGKAVRRCCIGVTTDGSLREKYFRQVPTGGFLDFKS